MSFVIAAPDLVQSAAGDLAAIRSSLMEASATASGPTTGIAAAAQDEVSTAIASLFGNFGQEFQALSAQAQAFHTQFVELMNAGAGAYVSAEAANAGQVLLGGGVLGNLEQGISGAVSGGGSAVGQIGQSASGTVATLGNGSLGAALSGQIEADVNAVSSAIAGAPVGLSPAIQTGGQAISQAVGGFESQLGALATGGVPGLINSASAFGASVLAPYQALVTNTFNNLQSLGSGLFTNPFPFVHQLVNNQIYYAQSIASAIGNGIANLPAELANLPATLQSAVEGLLSFNPLYYMQQFIGQQIGYAQTITTGLAGAARDFAAGVQQLPAGFLTAAQDLLVGNNVGAYTAINQTLTNAFLPGFTVTQIGDSTNFAVVPMGPLGDLAPILTIPAQMAQNFTNLLPAGSIPALMAQNATNLFTDLTSLGTTLGLGQVGSLSFGVPLQLLLDAMGAPANALSALNSSAVAFTTALQTGNVGAALASVLDAPANVVNGFLNGSTVIALPPAAAQLFGITLPSTTYLPLGGLLAPLSLPSVLVDLDGMTLPLEVTAGTPIGGLIPGVLSFGAEFAQDIALPAPVLPQFIF
ncbi:MAG: PE family protein [Mycobacterium sp.]